MYINLDMVSEEQPVTPEQMKSFNKLLLVKFETDDPDLPAPAEVSDEDDWKQELPRYYPSL